MSALTEYQKASLEVVKDVSLQLILIAVGVFSLAGSFLARQSGTLEWKGWLIAGFALLMFSVLSGLIALGNAVAQLSKSKFDVWASMLRWAYFAQLTALLFGGSTFAVFLLKNIR